MTWEGENDERKKPKCRERGEEEGPVEKGRVGSRQEWLF